MISEGVKRARLEGEASLQERDEFGGPFIHGRESVRGACGARWMIHTEGFGCERIAGKSIGAGAATAAKGAVFAPAAFAVVVVDAADLIQEW